MRCPVFIINLARSADRRQHMEAELKKVGITDYTFVNAIDGNDLKPEVLLAHQKKIQQHYNLTLRKDPKFSSLREYALSPKLRKYLNTSEIYCYLITKYELACNLSHLKCYELLLDSGAEAGLILEDDAELSADLPKIIQHVDRFSPHWQVAYAGHMPFRMETNIYTRKEVYKGYTMGQACGSLSSNLAYFISRKGATYWRHTRNLLGGNYPSIEAFCADLPTKTDSLSMFLLTHYLADKWLWNDRFNRYLHNYHIISPGLASWVPADRLQSTIRTEIHANPKPVIRSFWNKWMIVRTTRYIYKMLLGHASTQGFRNRFNKCIAMVTPFTAPSKRQW